MIQVELSAAEIPVEPGGTAQLTVTLTNRQDHDDHISLEIEGVDVEWYAIPVPSFNIAAGQSQIARILFKIQRSSASKAGAYPFLVRAKGMESGTAGIQQATLVIQPFSSLQVELAPKRGASTFLRHSTVFDVSVTNLGNRDESLDLYASDPEDACAYEFESDRISVRSGHTQTVPVLVEPVTRPVIGSSRLYGFTATARSVDDSYVSANAHGQLDRRPLLTTLTASIILLVILLGTGMAAFWPRAPQPPVIHSFTSNLPQVTAGDEVTLAWDVSNLGDRSVIQPDNIPVTTPVNSVKVRPNQTTNYVLVVRNGGREVAQSVTVEVRPKPIPPVPAIVKFTAGQRRIHPGDSVNLVWTVTGADEIMLNPLGVSKPAAMFTGLDVRPDKTTTYVLTAQGPGGVSSKSVTVIVVSATESLAEITSFRVKPEIIEQGRTATLTWSVENAASVEIDNGVGGGLSKPKGKFDVTPAQTTVYTLRAMDDKGNLRTKQVTVTVNPPLNPQPQDGAAPSPGGADGGNVRP